MDPTADSSTLGRNPCWPISNVASNPTPVQVISPSGTPITPTTIDIPPLPPKEPRWDAARKLLKIQGVSRAGIDKKTGRPTFFAVINGRAVKENSIVEAVTPDFMYRWKVASIAEKNVKLTPFDVQPRKGISTTESMAERKPEKNIGTPVTTPPLKARLSISAHIEDDPTQSASVIGNSDGRVQKGEAFDLVVIIANTGNAEAKTVTCSITLPTNKSLKAFSELHQVGATIAPDSAITNHFSLAMPLNEGIVKPLVCSIEINESGSDITSHLNYVVPTDLP
jgi:hypothetical protein